jgi:hypothetical protein
MAELHEAASREIEEEEKKKKRRAAISEASKSAVNIAGEGVSQDGGKSRQTITGIDEKSQLGPSASEIAADKGGFTSQQSNPAPFVQSPEGSRPQLASQQ